MSRVCCGGCDFLLTGGWTLLWMLWSSSDAGSCLICKINPNQTLSWYYYILHQTYSNTGSTGAQAKGPSSGTFIGRMNILSLGLEYSCSGNVCPCLASHSSLHYCTKDEALKDVQKSVTSHSAGHNTSWLKGNGGNDMRRAPVCLWKGTLLSLFAFLLLPGSP